MITLGDDTLLLTVIASGCFCLLLFKCTTLTLFPNKPNMDFELSEDSKFIVAFMEDKFAKFEEKMFSIINAKNEEIEVLRSEVSSLKKEVSSLKNSMDESDAYERRDTLIFSGNSVPCAQTGENCSNSLVNLIKDKIKMNIAPNELSVVHRLGPKPANQAEDKRPIMAKFCPRDVKKDVLLTARRARLPNFFVNESLTPARRAIFNTLRSMRRDSPDLLKGISTYDGKIYAYTKPVTPRSNRDQKHLIANHDDLVSFCREYIKKPIENFLANVQA